VQVEPPATEARAEPDAGAHQEAGAQRGPGADVVGYTVTVGTDGDARTVLRATDLTMSDAFADLVDWIEEHATGA
jgi:hypothetical protein